MARRYRPRRAPSAAATQRRLDQTNPDSPVVWKGTSGWRVDGPKPKPVPPPERQAPRRLVSPRGKVVAQFAGRCGWCGGHFNIGDTIIIIGFPGLGGSSLTVTRGIHSGIARFTDDPGSFIKTDTEINRGNSGGTAINAAGELIGIPTAGRFDREAPGKIGLVRPIDEARPLLDKFTR